MARMTAGAEISGAKKIMRKQKAQHALRVPAID
jgi:hypothetical protein